jgi:hypothetical protein
MQQSVKRPISATVVAVLLGVFGGLAVLTGSFWATRSLLSEESQFPNIGNEALATMSILSVVIGALWVVAAYQLWEKKKWAWQFTVFAGIAGILLSAVAHIVAGGFNLLSLSWVYPIVAVVAIVVLFIPEVREYYI